MTNRPRHPKPDANQADMVRDLRASGYTVIDVSTLGGDALDLFVGGFHFHRCLPAWLSVEVKTADGELTDAEREYIYSHPELDILVARCAEDVLRWFGAI